MPRSIVGLFSSRPAAEQAIQDLEAAGFDSSNIGIMMRDSQTGNVTTEHGTGAGEGAASGGILGGALGAVLAATGTLVIPGIGPFIAGGILATAIAGAVTGGIVGALAGLGIPKEEAEYYQDRMAQGGTLVTVGSSGRDAEARQILLQDGAEDLQNRGFGNDSEMSTGSGETETTHYTGGAGRNQG